MSDGSHDLLTLGSWECAGQEADVGKLRRRESSTARGSQASAGDGPWLGFKELRGMRHGRTRTRTRPLRVSVSPGPLRVWLCALFRGRVARGPGASKAGVPGAASAVPVLLKTRIGASCSSPPAPGQARTWPETW